MIIRERAEHATFLGEETHGSKLFLTKVYITDRGFFLKYRFGEKGKNSYKRELNSRRGSHEEKRGAERKVWSSVRTKKLPGKVTVL